MIYDELIANKNTLKFSVLIPIYFKEKPEYFEQAINSILNQSLKPDEILICKDGPLTNELNKLITSFVNKYPRLFKIIELDKNRGAGAARKLSVEKTSHDIIAIMDSDDIAKPERFEKQIKFLQENPDIDAVGSYVSEFEHCPQKPYSIRKVPLTHNDIVKYSKWRCPMNQQTVITKKENILKAGNYSDEYMLMEDYHLWVRMILSGAKFANIPECLVDMRAGPTMIKRRGLRVFKYEMKFFQELYLLNFISKIELCRNLFCKFWLRILPPNFRILAYDLFLRKRIK